MSDIEETYAGRWLHEGQWRGKEFSHELAEYDHAESTDGGTSSTPMRHAYLTRDGKQVGVWVPASWTDDQAREALESNW